MTPRHRRHRRWSLTAAALATVLTFYGAGLIHGTGVGHADATTTCAETR